METMEQKIIRLEAEIARLTKKQQELALVNETAKKAVTHVLRQIRNHPHVGWYLGFGTQSFELLTAAAAAAHGEPLEQVQAHFAPTDARNPEELVGDAS